jgi:hypothetical protein
MYGKFPMKKKQALIAVLVFVIGFIVGGLAVATFFGHSVRDMGEIYILILGAVIGGIIGFISSYSMWKVQINQNKKNIAQGFFVEISSLEKMLETYAKVFNVPGPGGGLVKIEQPLYNDGLFFAYRKELFAFDENLSKLLFEFYSSILTAERDRQVDKSDMFFKQANHEMKNSIQKANELLPKLKKLLKNEL